MQTFLTYYKKILNFINGLALKLAMVMLMIMLAVITFHVTRRYLMGNSLVWSEEVCRFMMVWMSFLLFPLAQQKGQNIAVDFVVAKFRYTRPGIACAIVVELLAMLVLAFCIKYGWAYMMRAAVTTSEVLGLRMQWVYFVLPYSFVMTFLCCVERLLEMFTCLSDPEKLRACDSIRSGEAMEV